MRMVEQRVEHAVWIGAVTRQRLDLAVRGSTKERHANPRGDEKERQRAEAINCATLGNIPKVAELVLDIEALFAAEAEVIFAPWRVIEYLKGADTRPAYTIPRLGLGTSTIAQV